MRTYVTCWNATILMMICAVMYGCVSAVKYQSKATSPAEGAVVRGVHEFQMDYWYKLALDEVDGEPVGLTWWSDWARPVLVDPGERVIKAKCLYAIGGSSTNQLTVELPVMLQAGHEYRLRNGVLVNAVAFWVEDTNTHRLAGKKVILSNAPSSPSDKVVVTTQASIGLLLRILILMGTGQ